MILCKPKPARTFWAIICILLIGPTAIKCLQDEPPLSSTSDTEQVVLEPPQVVPVSKEQALYDQCISVLTDLASQPSKHQSHLIPTININNGNDQDADLAVLFLRYLWRLFWSGSSSDLHHFTNNPDPEELPADVHVYNGSLDIPQFSIHDSPKAKRIKAIQGLMVAGLGMGFEDALMTLADMYLFGKYNHPRNASLAVSYYQIMSKDHGNATALSRLGFLNAVGIGVPRNYANAFVYTNFAALGGDTAAEQTLGYYHLYGIATPSNCEEAAFYYKEVADRAMERYRSGPPGGLQLPRTKSRLYDADGGVYGHGASGAGNPHQFGHQGYRWTPQEALQYHHYSADRPDGDVTSQLLLGQTYYTGTSYASQDFTKALLYFRKAAKQYPDQAIVAIQQAQSRGDPIPSLSSSQQTKAAMAAKAAGYLGRIYWRGEGVDQNNVTARWYFERGARQGDGASHTGLGMMYEYGVAGLPVNLVKAQHYYIKASDLNDSDGRVNLGELLLKRRIPDYSSAFKAFSEAVKQGHIYAQYRAGEMLIDGVGTQKNCPAGVSYLKMVVERADWYDTVVQDAQKAYEAGDVELALLKYLMAAERGYDVGQTNSVWLIDQGLYDVSKSRIFTNDTDIFEVALTLWNRAANQGNVDARVKVGDYYYYGLGTSHNQSADNESETTPEAEGADTRHGPPPVASRSPLLPVARILQSSGLTWLIPPSLKSELLNVRGRPDYERAALYYQVAAELEFSAMAMWNLGWMHEFGIGVERDYHLAKRFYDRALQTNPEAYLPVNICLFRLYAKWWFYTIFSPSSIATSRHLKPSASDDIAGGNQPLEATRLGRDGLPDEDSYLDEFEMDDEEWDWWGQEGDSFEDFVETLMLVGLFVVALALWWWRQALNNRNVGGAGLVNRG
ncbi:hypothetical protein SeMB42_g01683 [Synchytrium endobioticum]|uniref:Uncharacterized protein n=1 Tax=Synchytrium endobioticum TaxID=286115 RepID=A0A507DK62_9FUNG|nr:hypothetical protein SeLEV6574_g03751 [Synchytrium endobioticum]TPX52042.1 hypothetical protein SeMB42_g01683 [Synchytrium endobioticum]